MCTIIDYPDGTSLHGLKALLERHPEAAPLELAWVDGPRLVGLGIYLEVHGDVCLCVVDVRNVLDLLGLAHRFTDWGFEVLPKQSSRTP